MKHKRVHKSPDGLQTFAVIFDRGDEVAATLKSLAAELRLSAASFTGIGAFERVTVGWFDWEAKRYVWNEINEQVELLHMTGDVALGPAGEPAVHAHLTVGKRDGTAHGGHLKSAIVRPTLELILTESPAHLRKRLDPASTIPLISIDDSN